MDAPPEKGLDVVITVDLAVQTVTFVANGVELKAKLESPLSKITHVGYMLQGALIDVSPIQIERIE